MVQPSELNPPVVTLCCPSPLSFSSSAPRCSGSRTLRLTVRWTPGPSRNHHSGPLSVLCLHPSFTQAWPSGCDWGCREERCTSCQAKVRFRGYFIILPVAMAKYPTKAMEGRFILALGCRVQSIVAGIKSWCTGRGWTHCFHRQDRQRKNSCAHLTFSVLLSLGPLLTGMSPSIF